MCKEMPVILVDSVVDKKKKQSEKWRAEFRVEQKVK
jgi:hypothetical protein